MRKATPFCHLRVVNPDDDGDGHSDRHALFNGRSWYEYYPPSREAFDRVVTNILTIKQQAGCAQNARAGIINLLLAQHDFEMRLQADSPMEEWVECYHALYTASAIMIIYTSSPHYKGVMEYEIVRRWDDPVSIRPGRH